MEMELRGYERYQLEWMIDHGHSIKDLMNALENHRQNTFGSNLNELFNEWENEIGFKESEIWACEEEWLDNEAQEINEYISYNIGFIDNEGNEDETQFDIPANYSQSRAISDIMSLFRTFCKENNIANPSVIYIEEA